MEVGRASDSLSHWDDPGAAELLTAMPVDAACRLLRGREPSRRQAWLDRMPAQVAASLRHNIEFPEGTAGSLMEPVLLTFPEDTECGEVMRRVQRFGQPARYYVYVTDRGHRLTGVLTLGELLRAPARRRLVEWTGKPVTALRVWDAAAVVLGHAGWQSHHALPVVDEAGVLVGVVSYRKMRRLETEATVDRKPGLLVAGTVLGQAWMSLTTTMLDGFAGSLMRSRGDRARKEGVDG
jgi:magnesium transporter